VEVSYPAIIGAEINKCPHPQRALVGLLKMTGLRQLEVAMCLGVSRSRLASWLAGYSPMPDEMVLKVHRLVSDRLGRLSGSAFSGTSDSGRRDRDET